MRRAFPAVLAVLMVLAGCGGGTHHSRPRPDKGGAVAPQAPAASCAFKLGHGQPGVCGPLRGARPRPLTTQLPYPVRILDVSNNDPISCGAWRNVNTIGAYLKLNESTGFVDGTAAGMAACARAHRPGLLLGGYDFLHVCSPTPVTEAQLFIARLRALGLISGRALPPMGDAEFGQCGSAGQARGWLAAWSATVTAAVHRLGLYTGAWYFDPTFGCAGWQGSWAWISGYSVPWPFLPCAHHAVDLWQNTDNGSNGATNADLSVWVGSKAQFDRFAGQPPSPARNWLQRGDRGGKVWLFTHRLAIAGWLPHSGSFYSLHVAQVVHAYQARHRLNPVTGVAGGRTQRSVRLVAEYDRRHNVRDH